jgi:hypothetical protein
MVHLAVQVVVAVNSLQSMELVAQVQLIKVLQVEMQCRRR